MTIFEEIAIMANNSEQRPPVVHHVFFWLKETASPADRDRLIEGVKSLSAIPEIKELYVGVPASTEKRGVVDATWHVSELLYFEDLEAQSAYQEHPIHQEFIKDHSHLWERVVVYDTLNIS
jgi:hypothetical protein